MSTLPVSLELSRLADVLSRISADQWSAPSLCDGWTVRHVIAHLTMPVRYSPEAFSRELAAVDHDFTALSNVIAERDSARDVDLLLDDLRSETLANWVNPGGGELGALTHVVVHGLDVTMALGLGRVATDQSTRIVLDGLVCGGISRQFGIDVGDRCLQATDLKWSVGTGAADRRTAAELVLWLTGRA